ncbi:MAG TPA: hypothetical protein VMF61_02135 [Candidatus Acidoferrales bacterium]|nr:hypothetical protein [Candidatus Acidoferrales bacterium]
MGIRALFGVSAMVYGIASLLSPHEGMWLRFAPLGTPVATVLVWLLAILQVAGGIGLAFRPAAKVSALVLGAIYGLFALLCIPPVFMSLKNYLEFIDFGEQLAIAIGAFAVYAALDTNGKRAVRRANVLRIGLGICAVTFALAQIVYLQYTASLVPAWIPPNGVFWTNLTTAAFGLAAIALLIDVKARLASRLMGLMLVLFGVLVWVPRMAVHPAAPGLWTEFSSNYLIAAAALAVAEIVK